MSTTPSAIQKLRARADRLDKEAVRLRRLARDLELLGRGEFRLSDESQQTLVRLAKL